MKSYVSSQQGFSLVELLVAIVILAVGLLGLSGLQVSAMKTNSKSEGILAANSLAQMVIEEVMSLPGSDPLFDVAIADEPWPESPFTVAGGGTFNVTYDVVTPYGGIANLCRVEVKVAPTLVNTSVFGTRTVTMNALKRLY